MTNRFQSTLISKIVNAFRYEYQISGEKNVFLSFDGEQLSSDIKIEETELSDMDTLDCWIRPQKDVTGLQVQEGDP